MITISGTYSTDNDYVDENSINYIVEIPVNSFEDICEENMSIKDSDKMIAQAIFEKYNQMPKHIWVGEEV